LDLHLTEELYLQAAREEIHRGLTAHPKSLPPKYFYDARGSALFERITQLPEYYLTRAEKGLLVSLADELLEEVRPQEVVELGPGSTAKVRLLLDGRGSVSHLLRYVPFDVNRQSVEEAMAALGEAYPLLAVHGVVGDFERHIPSLPKPLGRRLVVFFGSTIGNLAPPARRTFLAQVRRQMAPGDYLLLGLDLVKDTTVLEAAYNDASGVTAEFNRNILRVVNRAVGGDFQPEAFRHEAYYNREAARIEMHLRPSAPQTAALRELGLTIRVTPEETIWTESSYKFTRDGAEAMLKEAGLRLERWDTDGTALFALALAGL
jgi:L-histidine N-alpha-methyltransferase